MCIVLVVFMRTFDLFSTDLCMLQVLHAAALYVLAIHANSRDLRIQCVNYRAYIKNVNNAIAVNVG